MSDKTRIVFCGVGALGSSAVMLCRNLNADLVFIDFDRVESKNLLSQSYVKQSVGKNKAQALKLQLANFYSIKSQDHGVRLAEQNVNQLLKDADLLVDCFDNAISRNILSAYARENAVPLVHAAVSADGDFGIVRWDENFTADQEDEAGQATCEGGEHLPFINLVSATLARSVQDFLTASRKSDYIISKSAVTCTYRGD